MLPVVLFALETKKLRPVPLFGEVFGAVGFPPLLFPHDAAPIATAAIANVRPITVKVVCIQNWPPPRHCPFRCTRRSADTGTAAGCDRPRRCWHGWPEHDPAAD